MCVAYLVAFDGKGEAERLQQQRKHAEEANILWQRSKATKERLITTESSLKPGDEAGRRQMEMQIEQIRSAYRAELNKIIDEYEDTAEAQYAQRSLREVFVEPQE